MDSALETRYFIDDDKFNKLYKSCQSYFQHIGAVDVDEKYHETTGVLYQTASLELQNFEMSSSKAAVVYQTNMQERSQYDEGLRVLESDIQQHREAIESLKSQLAAERVVRRHKEEYEVIARLVNAVPSRAETERKIEALSAEIAMLAAAKQALDREAVARSKQFYTFFAALDQLRNGPVASSDDTTATTTATSAATAKTTATTPSADLMEE